MRISSGATYKAGYNGHDFVGPETYWGEPMVFSNKDDQNSFYTVHITGQQVSV